MTDLNYLVDQVVDAFKTTPEYMEYSSLLAEIKKDSGLYQRLNDLRERNFKIQNGEGEDAMEAIDALTNEFEDVINNELVSDFLEAEVAYCHLIRDFSEDVVNRLEFE